MKKIKHHQAAAVLAAAVVAPTAQAETGPYYIGGLVAYTHSSNVLGLADGAAVPGSYESKSDNITSLALVGGLDQTIGRQRVFGDLTLRNNRYANNSVLNNNSYALTAGLDWETVENISGEVTLKTNRDLFRYTGADPAAGGIKNLVTSKQADAVARIGGITVLTFEGGAGYRSVDYSDANFDQRDNHQTYWLLGTRYTPMRGAYVGLNWRQTSGKYPHFQRIGTSDAYNTDSFDRRDINLVGYLEVSGLTTVSARIGRTKLDYERQGDFSGTTGLLKATWLPSVKLKLTGEVARDRGQDLRYVLDAFGTQAETASLVTALRTRIDYEVSGKVTASANLAYTRQPVSVFNNIFNFQEDGRYTSRTWGIGAAWTPTRTSRVGCDLSRERSRSNLLANLNVTANTLGCYAQLTLQP